MSAAAPGLTIAEERDIRAYAAGVARRNRPVTLLALSGLALIVAIVFAAVSASQARSARAAAQSVAVSRQGVEGVIAQIDALRRESETAQTSGRYSRQLQLSKLAAINQRVGLPADPSLQEQRARSAGPDSPIEKRIVDVTMVNAPLDTAMQWVNEALRAIPGLFITAFELRPTPTGWTVRVQVARWELKR